MLQFIFHLKEKTGKKNNEAEIEKVFAQQDGQDRSRLAAGDGC